MDDFTWRVGGPQGGGIETAATLFARAVGKGGWWVATKREYHSNIMGRHSYLDVRLGRKPVASFRDRVDFLVALDGETLARHLGEVREGGVLLYDPKVLDLTVHKLPMLDHRVAEDLRERLGREDPSLREILQAYVEAGVQPLPYPFEEVADRIGAELGVPSLQARRTLNTIAVAASLHFLGFPLEPLLEALALQFRGKVLELNQKVAEAVYREEVPRLSFQLHLNGYEPGRVYLTGAQAAALGKLAGGLRFQTYYPISPATDESTYLEAHTAFTGADVAVVQTEDEIAAVTMAVGAALTGAKAATATSGPGFSLMAEGMGFAGMIEAPLVVTLYQRGGPSTGMPTRTEQGDLGFALRGGHGEYPRLVLASGDLLDAFLDAQKALAWAWRYQTVVVHLLDKFLASTGQILPQETLKPLALDGARRLAPKEGKPTPYARYAPTEDGISPFAPLGTPGVFYWMTSDEHDPLGHITEDPVLREAQMEKRMQKLLTARKEIPLADQYTLFRDGEVLVLGFGSVKGTLLEALDRLPGVGYLHLRLLWPFPEIGALLEGKKLVTVEHNYSGQLADLVQQETLRRVDHRIVKYNGRPITLDEAVQALEQVLAGRAPERLVLRKGV
ncbi:2-oxoacid:ferredoxin oxidoreductase subunit alpha [Thermus scotoductus]|uniref:2-oxoacid:ferredoxin oxidoreductase subunit alpha n=1 Tax=Thermus scotoductus TaxID=37636 RepID=A0A430UZG6_THESC|nr:2-oxoacid:acceptor oxidoreductase subunit alpha [Thermus scotoductus]RTI03029.1 2-oxoacid:ferredoxin oxidoreductase subunit alpha [Thermus scotoductus]RTI15006.1 2-oxoacid:ferredoxin oxidoreductase subunit alpha [Thermus scotoductus]